MREGKTITMKEARLRALKSMDKHEEERNEYIRKEFESIPIYTEKEFNEAIATHQSSLLEQITEMKQKNVLGDFRNGEYNGAIDDIINLIKEGK